MDAQELRNLQEAYLEVYGEGYKSFPDEKVREKAKKLAPNRDDLGREPLDAKNADTTPEKNLNRARKLRLTAHTHSSTAAKQVEKRNKGPESSLYKKRSKTVEPQKSFPNRLRRSDGQGITDSYDYEAYMEVYDNELGEGYKRFPYKRVEDKIHKKEAANPTGRGTPQSVKMDTVFRHFQGEVRRTEKREHSPQISKAKEAENRARRTQKEQADIYDNIPSHLFDEEKRPLPVDKMKGQMFAHRVKSNDKNISKSLRYNTRANRIDDTLSGKRKPQVSRGKYAERERENNRFSNRLRRSDGQGIQDSYDYYDIILSHLLDEGYAETPEAAEVIMVNMSEEWRQSIIG